MPYRFLPDANLTGLFARETVTVTVDGDDYILDIGALTSNYRCIYGQGCRARPRWSASVPASTAAPTRR